MNVLSRYAFCDEVRDEVLLIKGAQLPSSDNPSVSHAIFLSVSFLS